MVTPLQPDSIGQQVDLLDVVGGGVVGEVDGLGDGVVGVLLEGRLQPDVPLGRDVVGGGEHLLHVARARRRLPRTVPSSAMRFMSSSE